MTAKKCDRCGAYYELYGVKNDAQNCNGFMMLNIDKEDMYCKHEKIDLCPDCMAKLYEFMKKEVAQ